MADKSYDIDILLNTAKSAENVKDLKKALKDLVSAQQDVDKSSPDFDKLVQGINDTEGAIGDLNDGFKTFAGSGMERLTNSTYLLKDGFDNLDLDKLKIGLDGLKQLPKAMAGEFDKLSGVINKLDFKSLGGNMKALSKSGVGELTKSIITLGKAILTNPVLLLGAVIAALVVAVVKFADKIKPLVAYINMLKDALDFVIDALTALTDAMGLTAIAAEESADRQIAAEEAVRSKIESNYNYRISLLAAQGKSTAEAEKEKQKLLQESAQKELDLLIQTSVANGTWTADKMKQLDELRKVIEGSKKEETLIVAKENKKQTDDEKAKLDAQKKLNEQAAKDKATANTSLNKQIEDQQISLIKDAESRDIEKARLDDERAIASIETSKASAAVKNNALLSQQEVFNQQLLDINTKYRDLEKAAELKKVEEDKKAKEEKAAAEAELKQIALDDLAAQAEIDVLKNESDLASRLEQLETQRDIDLQNTELTETGKNLITQQYLADKTAMEDAAREAALQKDFEANTKRLNTAKSFTNSAGMLSDTIFEIQKSNLKKGSKEEDEAARKNFKIKKAIGMVGVVIDTALGIVSSLKQAPLAIGPIPSPAGIASLAAVVASGALSFAKIAGTQFQSTQAPPTASTPAPAAVSSSSSSGSSGGSSLPTPAATSQFTAPQFYQLGQGGGSGSDAVKVVMVESDVTKSQNGVKDIKARATQTLGG